MKQSTTTKFAECPACTFFFTEPAVCQICKKADQFEPADGDSTLDSDIRGIDIHPFDSDWRDS